MNKKRLLSILAFVCILASMVTVAFAEGGEAAAAATEQAPWYSAIIGSPIFMIVIMIAIFYFLLIRPENKKKKETAKMRDNLKAGDKITTIGGMVGRIVKVKDDEIVFETSTDKTKIRIMKWAVSTVDKPASEKKSKNEDVAEESAELEAPEAVNEQTANDAEEK